MGWMIIAIIGLGIWLFAMDSIVLFIYEFGEIVLSIISSTFFWIVVVVVAVLILLIHFLSN